MKLIQTWGGGELVLQEVNMTEMSMYMYENVIYKNVIAFVLAYNSRL